MDSDGRVNAVGAQGILAERRSCNRSALQAPERTERWGLDPLFWVHARLLAYDFLRTSPNRELPGVFHLRGRNIRRVELQGICVEKHYLDQNELLCFSLDDGTGGVPCVLWLNEVSEQRLEEIVLGRLITIQGRPSIYREQHQVTVSSFQAETDPNKEVLYWLDAMHHAHTLYPVPSTEDTKERDKSAAEAGTMECTMTRALRRFFIEHQRDSHASPARISWSELKAIAPDLLLTCSSTARGHSDPPSLPAGDRSNDAVAAPTFAPPPSRDSTSGAAASSASTSAGRPHEAGDPATSATRGARAPATAVSAAAQQEALRRVRAALRQLVRNGEIYLADAKADLYALRAVGD
mmetsp:Transcript_39361/g.85630  ORF Transcript_39361/g.85630 Transcript_39361/m.85630 type:complete len:351 (+) Transcript_39361:123-1175(+)